MEGQKNSEDKHLLEAMTAFFNEKNGKIGALESQISEKEAAKRSFEEKNNQIVELAK